MTIGKRIRQIREFREITQKELGLSLGYPESSAAVRISQYESNTRVPKKNTIIEIAKILKCNWMSIYEGDDIGFAERTMQYFFWFEEYMGYSLNIFPLEEYFDREDAKEMSGRYNAYHYDHAISPIALVINSSMVNAYMAEWATRYREFKSKEISWDEYFEWKINWPDTCDDGGNFEPVIKWRKSLK